MVLTDERSNNLDLIPGIAAKTVIFARTGTVYFVGIGGNDANDGENWTNRRLTVASGYGLCSSGDTLIIGPGTFTEDINFDTDGVHLIGRGQGVNGTMISGNATMTCGSNWFKDMFFFDNAGTVVKVGADANAKYNEFPNCRIGGGGAAIDLHIDGSVAGGGSFNIFDDCNFYDATQASVLIDGGAATGNIFRECRVRPTTNGHGIHVNHASALRNTFLDCTVVGNSSGGTGIYFQAGLANIAANCHVDDITTPYNIAATNHIVGCHEGSLIAANNTTEDDLKKLYDDLDVIKGTGFVTADDSLHDISVEISEILNLTRTGADIAVTAAETNLFIDNAPAKILNGISIKIDTTDMEAADTYEFREYYRIESAGSYIEVADTITLTGVQSNPLYIIPLEPYRYGCKVTAKKTAGTDRAFPIEAITET